MLRQQILNDWLAKILETKNYISVPLQNDASLRQYYRILALQKTYILMDAPHPESPELFLKIAKILKAHHLTVPDIYASNLEHGFILLSDFGDRLYLNELNLNTAAKLYEDAIKALIQMQKINVPLQHFNSECQKQQLDSLFKNWYLKIHLNCSDDLIYSEKLDSTLNNILNVISQQPQVFIHRDYHSRNLMILESNNPGILDFQDALIGGITYDLVSLLQDCYITWPRTWVENFVADFQERLVIENLLAKEISKEIFLKWFDFTGLQRHLKNLGIFTRKWHRDQNDNYLKDLPVPLQYIHESLERYHELKPLQDFFNSLKIETKKGSLV